MTPLISVDRARQAISRTNWPTAEIDRVATLVGVISHASERYCRRRFARATHDLVLAVKGDPLWLPHPPVHSVTSVVSWPTETPISVEAVLPPGWLRILDPWPFECERPREKLVRIVYEAGFDPIPDDIQEAVAVWTATAYWQTKQDPAQALAGPPPAAACLLQPYRRTILC